MIDFIGEKSNMLRVKKISDLIHGAPVGKPVESNRCHVTLTFEERTGNVLEFSRIVAGSSSDYRINKRVYFSDSFDVSHFVHTDLKFLELQSNRLPERVGADWNFHQSAKLFGVSRSG